MDNKNLLTNLKGVVSNIQDQLNNKADVGHTHDDLVGGAPAEHTHKSSDITDFKDKLDAKADLSHKHTKSDISDFPSSMPANGGNADTVSNFSPKENFQTNMYIPVVKNSSIEIGSKIDFHTTQDGKDYEGRLSYLDGDLMWQNYLGNKDVNITEELRNLKQNSNSGGTIKSVQRGYFVAEYAYQSSPGSVKNISLNDVDPNKCLVFITGSVGRDGIVGAQAVLLSMSQYQISIGLTYGDFNANGKVSWEVIEYA